MNLAAQKVRSGFEDLVVASPHHSSEGLPWYCAQGPEVEPSW